MPIDHSSNTEHPGAVNPGYHIKKDSLKSVSEYANGILTGNRAMLSKAITLIESTKKEYHELGIAILEKCYSKTGNSIRIGITGVPGVGKSTFIEKFGMQLIENNRKVAVLAVDPSSSLTKGSILGDKTRMETLAVHKNAFVRPTPSSGTLGGVAGKTREVILLCEAAGFDTILVETIGVGQSEITVKSMVDFFLLLMLAGAGDELQGIKRGIVETADMIVIHKADGLNIEQAARAKLVYQNALSLFPAQSSGWNTPVLTASAFENKGLNEVWEIMEKYIHLVNENGYFMNNRKEQLVCWLNKAIEDSLKRRFYNQKDVKKRFETAKEDVLSGVKSPVQAASELMN